MRIKIQNIDFCPLTPSSLVHTDHISGWVIDILFHVLIGSKYKLLRRLECCWSTQILFKKSSIVPHVDQRLAKYQPSSWPPIFVNNVFLELNHSHSLVSGCFVLQQHCWLVVTETKWPTNLKYLLSGPWRKSLSALDLDYQKLPGNHGFVAWLSLRDNQTISDTSFTTLKLYLHYH